MPSLRELWNRDVERAQVDHVFILTTTICYVNEKELVVVHHVRWYIKHVYSLPLPSASPFRAAECASECVHHNPLNAIFKPQLRKDPPLTR